MPLVDGKPVETYELDTYNSSYGTLIMMGDGQSPETYHVIAGLGDIDGPNSSINVVSKNTHSTGKPYVGKGMGLIDAGELKFPVNYVASNPSHSDTSIFGLGYVYNNRLFRNFRIVSTDPSRIQRQFRGFISEFSESHPVDGADVRNTTVQIDGAIEVVA